MFPFVILLGCLGVGELARGRPVAGTRARRLGLIVAGGLVLLPTVIHWGITAGQFALSVRNVEDGNVAAARWLGSRLAAGATLAVNDIGAIKYLLPEHEIYDLAGIVTPEVHAFTRAAVAQRRPWEEGIRRYLESVRPDYLVVFPAWFPTLLSAGVSFQPQREFAIPGNIALGGDRLVIYTTPWTRQAQLATAP
ncbi:MAG: hypothetical protein O7A04_04635 [Acidobacteria bacterium]|nr:hypothetical protein [Acidobacteriota bacterium]